MRKCRGIGIGNRHHRYQSKKVIGIVSFLRSWYHPMQIPRASKIKRRSSWKRKLGSLNWCNKKEGTETSFWTHCRKEKKLHRSQGIGKGWEGGGTVGVSGEGGKEKQRKREMWTIRQIITRDHDTSSRKEEGRVSSIYSRWFP